MGVTRSGREGRKVAAADMGDLMGEDSGDLAL
jgi:hypothetical protein